MNTNRKQSLKTMMLFVLVFQTNYLIHIKFSFDHKTESSDLIYFHHRHRLLGIRNCNIHFVGLYFDSKIF